LPFDHSLIFILLNQLSHSLKLAHFYLNLSVWQTYTQWRHLEQCCHSRIWHHFRALFNGLANPRYKKPLRACLDS